MICFSGLGVPAILPSYGSTSWDPPLLCWVPQGGVPQLRRSSEGPLTPYRPSRCPSFPRTPIPLPRARLFAPSGVRARLPGAWSLVTRGTSREYWGGGGRASQVPAGPLYVSALFLDPGGTSVPGQYGTQMLSATCATSTTPTMSTLSGLNCTALTLAVYASPPGSPRGSARLASGCWPDFAGRGWSPAGSLREVSAHQVMVILLSQAYLSHGTRVPP